MNKICFGCGVKLQVEDLTKEGFIPQEKYKDSVYCQRCYKLIHYGTKYESEPPKSINKIIDAINSDNKFVVYLIDFLNLNSNTIEFYHKIKAKKMLIISKCDLIPKSIKPDKLKKYLKDVYKIKENIRLISSVKNFGVNSLNNYLENNIFECYIVGSTNSGKSSLINALIELNNSHINKTAISKNKNTTLDFIRIPLKEKLLLIDSPGLVMESYEYIHETKGWINPKTYQMNANETLNIDNFYINFQEKTSATLYLPNDIHVKKYYKDIKYDKKLIIDQNQDLVIKGLGFINIKNKNELSLACLDLKFVELRKSILGDYRE